MTLRMVSDDERREAAERLRDEVGCGSSWPGTERLGLILGIKREPRTGWEGRILTRLADLINPGDMSQGRRDIVACDREALLALADKLECDGDCNGCDMGGGIWCGAQVYAARRIREACGEVVA